MLQHMLREHPNPDWQQSIKPQGKLCTTVSDAVPTVRYPQTSSSQSKELDVLLCTAGSPTRIKSRTSKVL